MDKYILLKNYFIIYDRITYIFNYLDFNNNYELIYSYIIICFFYIYFLIYHNHYYLVFYIDF